MIAGDGSVNDIGDDGDDIGEQCVKSNSDEGAVEEGTEINRYYSFHT
jgi:hypothetical protein